MARLRNWWNLPCPNAGLLLLIAGIAMGNSFHKSSNQQTFFSKRDTSSDNAATGESGNVVESTLAGETRSEKRMIRLRAPHPLDPLSALEMQYVGNIVRQYNTTSKWQFKCIGLLEPDKAVMFPYFKSRTAPPPALIPRKAMVLICCPTKRIPIFVVVNLSVGKVESWTEGSSNDKVAVITTEDSALTREIALREPEVLARLKAKGYNDVSNILTRLWDAGYVADNPNYAQAKKLIQVYFYATKYDGSNFFAHPFDFVVYVELGPNVVRGIENLPIQQDFNTTNRQGDSVPTREYDYFAEVLQATSFNHDLRRIQISQPNGASYKISGREVTWQGFNFRVGFNPREGFYLYTISFNDKGNIKPLIYRLSMSESHTFYGDPRPPYHRKETFDEGNYEFGSSVQYLPVHQFCRGKAFYFQADLHNEYANTYVVHNSLCVMEEDAGILWAHRDVVSGKINVIRNQRLVLSHLVTHGRMDFWISWRFYLDGAIELAIQTTGILSTNLMAVDVKPPPYGTLVAPQVYSQNYQHFFAVRADVDVDGPNNTVSFLELGAVSETDNQQNPYGNGITFKGNDLKNPVEAKTDSKGNTCWGIKNPSSPSNSINGQDRVWFLSPVGSTIPSLLSLDSPTVNGRLNWTKHNMWILPYNASQLYAAGEYLNEGVDQWTNQNANADIRNTDVVLFYVFNYLYAPRTDDWPIASALNHHGTTGFWFRPFNYFDENPALYSPRASETTLMDDAPSMDIKYSS